MVDSATNDVYYAELFSDLDLNITDVVIGWQHIVSFATEHEVDHVGFFSLRVDVLHLIVVPRFQQGTDPRDERPRLVLEEVDCLITGGVDVHRKVNLQLVWELLKEVNDLLVIISLILHIFLAGHVKVLGETKLLLDGVKDL